MMAPPTEHAGATDPLAPIAAAVVAEVRHDLEQLRDEIAALREVLVAPNSLLDRQGCARLLGCSTRTLDALRREPGFPELRVADAPRFDAGAVMEWLRSRSAAARQLRANDGGRHGA